MKSILNTKWSKYRKGANLTQAAVSKSSGLSVETIKKIEKGNNVTLLTLSKYLGVCGAEIKVYKK